ncbi:striated muscle-specific serine/threonine-protein kinase-like [Battus philenor]|uniref:striated muscle-specific serine/threonine-protein kinase-like n=1 Tax=Battus philenor TaxID=42288 RepID=UPI0035D08F20
MWQRPRQGLMDICGSRRALTSGRCEPCAANIRGAASEGQSVRRRQPTRADVHLSDMAAAHTHTAPAPSDRRPEGRAGSRRIFPPQFKLQVLEAYRRDAQCRGNQRATARKFGIHRRQIQKWLQAEPALRAALLRRAPQPAPSPPPYAAGSPESARLPSPPPPPPPTVIPTPVPIPTPMPSIVTPMLVALPTAEPIDLSLRRLGSPPVPTYAPPVPEQPKKPFKLFRPYLLEDEEEKSPGVASLPVAQGVHVSAFVPVQSAALGTCLPRWCAPLR